jgi:replication-associated recombination protein RarA
MERLWSKYSPTTLNDVLGQPCVATLKELAKNPHPACVILEGSPGVGKSASALSFANDLGCVDEFHGLHRIACTELGIEEARRLFCGGNGNCASLHLRPMMGPGWHVLLIEEMELVHPTVQAFLKDALDVGRLPSKVIVLATSNGVQNIKPALRQRFKMLCFTGGEMLAASSVDFLAMVWKQEFGRFNMPELVYDLGWSKDGLVKEYSLRLALDQMQDVGEAMKRRAERLLVKA